MQKYEQYNQFSYINEKQLQIYCCALALGMANFSSKEMEDFSTLTSNKKLLQRNLIFLNCLEVRTLAISLIKVIEYLLESKSKLSTEIVVDFTDFYLLENYLSKFRYFYLTYRSQEILEDNRHINFMSDNSLDINYEAFMALNLVAQAS